MIHPALPGPPATLDTERAVDSYEMTLNPSRTHPSLIARLREGRDEDAWRELDDRYRDLVLHYCRARGLQESDADDVRQLVMFALARSIRQFEYDPARGRFSNYLKKIIQNEIYTFLNAKGRLPQALDSTAPEQGAAAEEDSWNREWENYHIRRAFARLAGTFEKKSILIFSRLLEGAAAAELARELNTTIEAIHKIRQRVRGELERLVAEQIREEDGV